MKEGRFLKLNQERWQQLESLIKGMQDIDSDQLADGYIRLNDDLAYARTYYPNSKTTDYLNGLAAKCHQLIYKNKKEDRNQFWKYFSYEVPLAIYGCRKEILLSLALFLIAALIGAMSLHFDENFVRLILGDAYVNLTERNISNGDPMGIYASRSETSMFSTITFNNIRVSFFAFALGILTSVGPGYLLLYNGVMLGVFQYYFYQQGLLGISVQAIWIHGTIEITSIILAGGAGICLGNGWLFPGTYKRSTSLIRRARVGIKLLVGLVPMFILAGFLESYVTRYYQYQHISIAAISFSLLLISFYYIYLPYRTHKNAMNHE